MSHEEQTSSLSRLATLEAELRDHVMQDATTSFHRAIELDAMGGEYLQREVFETPVETLAFRLDSKQFFLGKDNLVERHKLFIYVPIDQREGQWLTHFWFKYQRHDGVETMFEIDEKGVRPYIRKEELRKSAKDEVVDEVDINIEKMLAVSTHQKRRSIVGMRNLSRDLHSSYTNVPFFS